MKRKCDNCGKEYNAKEADVNRGWGLCCSKSCAASKREKNRPGYDPKTVEINNERRMNWHIKDSNHYGDFTGKYTSEGYRIYGHTAINEFGEPVYDTSLF